MAVVRSGGTVIRLIAATAAALVAIAALGAGKADAAAVPASKTLALGPIKVRGYNMDIFAREEGGKDTLSVSFTRTSGKSTQSYFYSFKSGVNFKPNRALTSATLTAKLGAFGRINVRFALPRKAAKPKSVPHPPDCPGGLGKSRRSTATGTLRFIADKTFFKTISAKKMAATFTSNPARNCPDPKPTQDPPERQQVSLSNQMQSPSAPSFFVSRDPKKGNAVTQSVSLQEKVGKAEIFRSIFAQGLPATSFTTASDASSAQATGPSPFLSGTARFTAAQRYQGGANGTLSGDYTARFDQLGAKRLFSGGNVPGFLSLPTFKPPNQAPTAAFEFSQLEESRQVQFADNSTDTDGSVVAWAWNFGEGGTSAQRDPVHTYASSGTYTVTLTVTDNEGATNTVSRQVTVTEPSGGGGGEEGP